MLRRTAATSRLVLALIALVASAAAADDADVEVGWDAPASCPAESAVLRDVRAMLRESTGPAHAVQARARVTRVGGRFHVDLVVKSDGGRGVRAFDADSCAEIADAVALITALSVDPTIRAPLRDAGADAPADGAPDPPIDAAAHLLDRAPDPRADAGPAPDAARGRPPGEEPRDDSPRAGVAATFAADVGSMPSFAAGADLTVLGLYRRWRAEVHGALWADQHASDPARPSQGAALSLASLGARACYAVLASDRPARTGMALAPCVAFDVDRVSGAGIGASSIRTGDAFYAEVGGGLVATWSLSSTFALRLGADLLAPIAAPTFVVLGPDGAVAERLFRTSPAVFRLGAGVEFRIF